MRAHATVINQRCAADEQLHEDSRRRYASIVAKQAQLKELEGSVSDGVVELDKVSSHHSIID